jgi:hypothetical protein
MEQPWASFDYRGSKLSSFDWLVMQVYSEAAHEVLSSAMGTIGGDLGLDWRLSAVT